ncbi:MAG TPA: ThaI family type II restriction endonuclease [Ignavibacteriaceae bacterium]|nr:ThaI family type II restriction endonuclease [Ignavibacteriaceae bacterium]
MTGLIELFTDPQIIKRIQDKLPKLFSIADLESQRAGRVGMEVGSLRERIIVSLLIYKFGEINVDTEIPITEPEIDVRLFNKPISIKTKTGSGFAGVKLIWTVDAQNSKEFLSKYIPSYDMIYVQINWENKGCLYYFPVDIQREVFEYIGRETYSLTIIDYNKGSFKIEINWIKEELKFNSFKRWVDLWAQD